MSDKSRWKSRAGVLALVVAAGATCLFFGRAIATPQEAALPAAPDEVVTVAVESRALTGLIAGTGEVSAAGSTLVVASAGDGREGVVSKVAVSVGDPVTWCAAPIDISGRPLIMMQGNVSAYRDLSMNDVGPDVTQLQQSLIACGYSIGGGPDGNFGAKTQQALQKLYADLGYPVTWVADDDAAKADEEQRAEAAAACEKAQRRPTGATDDWVAPDPATIPACNRAAALPSTPEKILLPRSEIAYIPMGGSFSSVAPLNTPLTSDPVLSVAYSGLSLAIAMSPEQRLAVEPGMTVHVVDGAYRCDVTLPDLPTAPQVDEQTKEPYFPVVIALPADADPALSGTLAEYSITLGTGEVYPLVVPVTALFARADGSTFVTVVDDANSDARTTEQPARRDVIVTITESLGGYAAIEVVDGELRASDRVIVSQQ